LLELDEMWLYIRNEGESNLESK